MTGFDIIVLLIVAVAAVGGFLRGFVQEVLSLTSWLLAVAAIRFLHTDLSAILLKFIGTPSGAAVSCNERSSLGMDRSSGNENGKTCGSERTRDSGLFRR